MPISTLDPNSALLVVDLQNGLADLPTLTPVREIARRAGRLAAAFRAHHLPVVLITAAGVAPGRTDHGTPTAPVMPPEFADPLTEIEPRETDYRIVKNRWGAFHDTGLLEHLRLSGTTQVVIAGVATSVGVESTARAAYDAGLHVTIATDATTDVSEHTHQHTLTAIFPSMSETATIDEIVDILGTSGSVQDGEPH